MRIARLRGQAADQAKEQDSREQRPKASDRCNHGAAFLKRRKASVRPFDGLARRESTLVLQRVVETIFLHLFSPFGHYSGNGTMRGSGLRKRKMHVRRLIGVGILAAIVVTARAEVTSADEGMSVMWRFDGNGRFPGIRPPAEWRSDKNILWKASVEIGGYSSPIVVRDRVFVTAEMGSLTCLDLADGKVLWKKDLFSKESKDIPAELSKKLMRGCGGDSKQSTPTPASNGELVFYVNAMGLCACYDLKGNQKWIRIIETAEDEEHFSSSPIFAGDRIILSWGCLVALSAKDGRTLWKAADAKVTYGTPTLARIGKEEVVITPGGNIVRLADGEVLCSELFESTYTTPLVEGNTLYLVDAETKALELPARAEKGMRLKERWKTSLGGRFMASPSCRDGLLYTVESTKSRLHIIDAKTGKVLTVTKLLDDATKKETTETGTKIEGLAPSHYTYASPVATEKNIFFFDDAGNTAILELGREYKPVRVNKLGDGLIGTPFFTKNRIILRGTQSVYCVAEKP
jgi:outer membrane protein assembly factor BamB